LSLQDPIQELLQLIRNLKSFTNVDTDPVLEKIRSLLGDIYDLFLGLQGFNRKRQLAILRLAHLFPETLTTVELREIMEYSDKTSLSYVRNELKDLENAQLIVVKKYADKKLPYQIQINHNHRLMKVLISLSNYGREYKKLVQDMVKKSE
jgi:DNA-binding HxlR family transcriptional regulator